MRWITAQQIEAARIAITRHVKRGGQVWIRVIPDKPFTKKPAETRMGKVRGPGGLGGGNPARPYPLRDGRVDRKWPKKPCGWPPHKLPIPTKFVEREHHRVQRRLKS